MIIDVLLEMEEIRILVVQFCNILIDHQDNILVANNLDQLHMFGLATIIQLKVQMDIFVEEPQE